MIKINKRFIDSLIYYHLRQSSASVFMVEKGRESGIKVLGEF